MRTKSLLFTLPVLCLTSCFSGQNAAYTDDANDAAGTYDPYLAREVVGVHMLTTDANYDKPCNYLGEEYVRGTFKLDEGVAIEEFDQPNGCEFHWGEGNKVGIYFGQPKPYPSLYHAEYIFNKMYQPQANAQLDAMQEKAPLSGPSTFGIVSERPAILPETSVRYDNNMANDSSNSYSGVTPQAANYTQPAQNTATMVAVQGVGDKAVWDPAKKTLHVLANHHILNVSVDTKTVAKLGPGRKPVDQQTAAKALADVVLTEMLGGYFGPINY